MHANSVEQIDFFIWIFKNQQAFLIYTIIALLQRNK